MTFPEGIKRAHLVGAGGIGISAVGKLLKHFGAEVSGSDVGQNEATAELEAAGIPVAVGHDAQNVPDGIDLLVFSDAVPDTDPERAEARRRGVREMSYFDFIGEFSRNHRTVAVSGTNGKSTTTAMLGVILESAGLDPTVIVGSKVSGWPDRNLRLGHSDLFVVEACEYRANMLKLHPSMIVLTNIEEDHLDYYRDLAHIRDTFQSYIENLPPDGKLILNADDPVSSRDLRPKSAPVTYGLDSRADYSARILSVGDGRQIFSIAKDSGAPLGEFSLSMPGIFNVQNALAAATAALELGVRPTAIAEALTDFHGLWRRFERLGEFKGAPVISDYGHHPSAVRLTLAGARQFFPGKRLVLVFQPHQRNRTRKLFAEFVTAFDGADLLILPEIFDVTGRESPEDRGISSRDLVAAVRERDLERGMGREAVFAQDLAAARSAIESRLRPDDVILIMGAGDVHTLAKNLV